MARAKANESRKAKIGLVEELTHGVAKLRELSAQIEDLSREGFPYREAGRARTELSLRETIRRLFGEKSPEYQAYKHHKLRVGSRAESAPSIVLIKQLIAALETQKTDPRGLKHPLAPAPDGAAFTQPILTSVPFDPSSECPSDPGKANTTSLTTINKTTMPSAVSVSMTTTLATPLPTIPPTSFPARDEPLGAPSTSPTASEAISNISPLQQPDVSSSLPAGAAKTMPAPAADGEQSNGSTSISTPPTVSYAPAANSQATVAPISKRRDVSIASAPSQSKPTQPTDVSEPVEPSTSPSHPPTASIISSTATVDSATVSSYAQGSPVSDVASGVRSFHPLSIPACTPAQLAAPVTNIPGPLDLAGPQTSSIEDGAREARTLDLLRRICTRFHLVARQLRLRKEYRPTLEITDEYDLQDLFYALLRLQFDEVGTEEWTPSYTNGARRTSYLLDWDRIVVVVKQTGAGCTAKGLSDQIKSDAAHYATRPNGTTLVCFIYDPDGRVGNPRGLEADLTTVSDTYLVEVIVAPK